MADEVTTKDLQALEKKFNNQIAALKKEIADKYAEGKKNIDEVESAMVAGNQGHLKTFREIEPKITALQNECKDYGKRIVYLEQQGRMIK